MLHYVQETKRQILRNNIHSNTELKMLLFTAFDFDTEEITDLLLEHTSCAMLPYILRDIHIGRLSGLCSNIIFI